MAHPEQPKRGAVRYALIHHGACPAAGRCHYRVAESGQAHPQLAEHERGPHPRSIAVALDGDFDLAPPAAAQLEGLRTLLLQLKLRYPALTVGAHRQVRGEGPTACPGRLFPLQALLAWSRSELLVQRDAALEREVESQYSG